MNTRYTPLVFLLLFITGLCTSPIAKAQVSGPVDTAGKLVKKIILIGDAGELAPDLSHPVVEAAERLIPMDSNTYVIYLGDNLYRHGLPDQVASNYQATRAVLDSQANITRYGPKMVYFIPGNHDWMNGQPGGWNAIIRQQRYIDGLNRKNLTFLPKGGCPGPEEIDLGDDVVLVIMDSQWWIHDEAKPGLESDCDQKTEAQVVEDFREILNKNYRKLVIVAMHHPFYTNGVHGGYYGLKQHIFPFTDLNPRAYVPLPVLGSIYPISRGVFGTPEDVEHPRYQNMVKRLDPILKEHPNAVLVSGHDHNLEWIVQDSNRNYIISGSGSKHNRVQKSARTKFVTSSSGFAVMEIYNDKNVDLKFYTAAPDSTGLQYAGRMLNYGNLPPQATIDTTIALRMYHDTVLAPASIQYQPLNKFQTLFAGHNYRKQWSEPVGFKTFRLNSELGGLTITGMGGGMQTKSLQLVDKNGKEWKLRTIDKDPTSVVPDFLRGSIAQDLVQDMISAGYPYAPLIISGLSEAAGVPHSNPTFYYVPDNYNLGDYRRLMANKIAMLEPKDVLPGLVDTKSTNKLFEKMRRDNDNVVEQRAVLKARLLDWLVADWDRHFDQWRWLTTDTGKGKLYFPLPRDRDQAFFNSDGLILKVASRNALPWMKGFHNKMSKVDELSFSARDFDRLFMNAVDKRMWTLQTDSFINAMTNDAIAASVGRLPQEIRAMDSAAFTSKLISRRNQLKKASMKYYRFISKTVTILGSNEQEYFTAKGTDTGILVQVHARRAIEKGGDTSMLIYTRTIKPSETKEVQFYGFGGNDYFDIDSSVRGRTRFRFIGGDGADTFDIRGHVRTLAYDLNTVNNPIINGNRLQNRFSSRPDVNYFTLPNYYYPEERFPRINLGYNPDDGILAGIGYLRRTYGFRPDPFHTEHRIHTLFSFTRPAFEVGYQGTFNNLLFGGPDLMVHGLWQNPALTNFFGLGNETRFDPGKKISYYRTRYNWIDADVLARIRPFKVLSLGAGVAYNRYWNRASLAQDRILENPGALGLDRNDLYTEKAYLGGRAFMLVDNTNSTILPTRGIRWYTQLDVLQPLNHNSKPYSAIKTDMTVYASLATYNRLTAVIRLGGGNIFSSHYEWFQALSMGDGSFLRGFYKDRWRGNGYFHSGLELRAKIVDVNSHILPGAFGVLAFDNVGRVMLRGESSRRWHNSYGGGLYYAPFNQIVIGGTVGFSEDPHPIFNFSIGTNLHLSF